MIHFFDDFTEEEVARYEEYDFEPYDGGLHHLDLDFDVYKYNDKYYVQMNEEEQCFQEMNGRIYLLDPVWYLPVDLDAICKDYADGNISEYFNAENYEVCLRRWKTHLIKNCEIKEEAEKPLSELAIFKINNIMKYAFKVIGKGRDGAPKGLSVTVIRDFSGTPLISEIVAAFQREHGIKVSGTPGSYDIQKLSLLKVYKGNSSYSSDVLFNCDGLIPMPVLIAHMMLF